MRRNRSILVCAFLFGILLAISAPARGQNVGSLEGQVTDPSGAAVVKATVEATDTSNDVTRTTQTDDQGSYAFTQLTPGTYRLKVTKDGFKTYLQARVSVLVATPTRLDIRLTLGAVTQSVTVESAAAPTINTQDATVGNTFGEQEIKDLPILARNIVNLLTIQPGVVFTGISDTDKLNMGSIATMDSRDGVVDGIRGNQTNVTLDGVDSNDWQNQSAFTSSMPVTLDSVQEFRVTTTNANATNGLTGGAQVQLVTKSGSDQFHGDIYWYYRTTGTSANSWFNNDNGIPRPKLQRQQPGGAFGGPIKKDRAFFFLNNEERRDAIGAVEDRIVPSDSLRDGVLIYQCLTPASCSGGSVQGITATHPVAAGYFGIPTVPQPGAPVSEQQLDPLGQQLTAASPMVPYMNLFPHGNDPTQGDDAGTAVANFIGYRFNAPELTSENIYIARFDYNLTADGHHSIFWRGSMEGLRTDLLGAQFPGAQASQGLLNNSRGFSVQYQGQLSPTLINTARYGYIREGIALSGSNGPLLNIRDFTDVQNFGARLTSHAVPVHEINDDLSKTLGKHTLQVGGVIRFINDHRIDESQSFPSYAVNDGFCVGCAYPTDQIGALGLPTPSNPTAITRAFMMLTGPITDTTATFFGSPATGAIQPAGTPDSRRFGERSFETYVQDTWRIHSNLTLTFGLRYGYETPVWETNGFEVAPSFDIMTWFKQRVNNMNAGIPSSVSPLLEYVPAGKANHEQSWYSPDFKDFGPRLSLAYSPDFNSGFLGSLFGGPGKSSLRLGAGIFYDSVGLPIALSSDQSGSPGTATTLTNNSQAFCLGGVACTVATPTPAPRFAGTCSLSTGCTGLPDLGLYVNPPASAVFPAVPAADESSLGFAVDPGLRTPYSMHFNVDFQRELPHHIVVDVGYVGTLGRRLLGKVDYAQYEDIRDPASGQDMWTAFRQVAKVANLQPQTAATPAIRPTVSVGSPPFQEPNVAGLSQIASVAWFTNMLPGMPTYDAQNYCKKSDPNYATCVSGYESLTPTQAFYAEATQVVNGFGGGASWSCALFPIDSFVSPGMGNLNSPWNSTVDPNGTGLVQFQPQFATLPGWTNWASSNYHSLQISVRRSVGNVSFAANYVFSKSIDNASGGENVDLSDSGSPTQAAGALIQNPFDHRLGRGISDFNLKHNFNGDWVVTMPFGHGQRYFGSANRVMDAIMGGWEVSGAIRWHSGFPESPSNGFDFPTNFFLTTNGTLTGPVSNKLTRKGTGGIPNLFGVTSAGQQAPAAWQNFGFTLPGLPGTRNTITGPAYAATDVGVSKSFRILERETLKLQARAYNVFNSVNFDDTTLSLDPTSPGTFGQLTGTTGPRGGAREMEFAARFEF